MFRTLGLFKHNWKSFDFDLELQIIKKGKVWKFGWNDDKKFMMAAGHNSHNPLWIFLSRTMSDGASQSALEFKIFPFLIFKETPSATWQASLSFP